MVQNQLMDLNNEADVLVGHLRSHLGVLQRGADAGPSPYRAPTTFSGGRPRFDITAGQLERLHSLDFSKVKIAELLGVSRWTIHRRVKDLNLDRPYADITEEELDFVVRTYRSSHPFTGMKLQLSAVVHVLV